jgi:hypothetical protein
MLKERVLGMYSKLVLERRDQNLEENKRTTEQSHKALMTY